jgi:hypothetical protein
MEAIQVRDDDDDDDDRGGSNSGTRPDIIVVERGSCFPLSKVVDLEPERRDAEEWLMGSNAPSIVSWGMTAACVLDCGNLSKSVDSGGTCGMSTPVPTSNRGILLSNTVEVGPLLGPKESDAEGWVLEVCAPSNGSMFN